MNFSILATERAVICFVAMLLTYLCLVTLGRQLKRRAHLHLGIVYQIFCVVLALFLPLMFLGFHPVLGPFDILRELKAAAILLGTVFVLALVRRYLWEIYFGQKRQTDIPRFLQELAALVVFVVAVILVLNLVYGQNIPGLVAGSGIIAVILGLAMQDLLGNIFAGVSIHISKPFKPGDWLIADNQQAEVIEVNWRSTRLRTNDHVYLDIPNSHITKGTIVNYSFPTKLHAMRLRVGVDYSLPPNAAKDALIRAALDANGVLPSPRPKAFVVDFGDSAVIYEVKFWLENHALINEINDSIRTDIWYEFDRRRIKIPFPTRTLRREPPEVERTKEISGKTRASLRNQPIFQCLDDSQFDRMLSMGTRLRFGREEHIIRQGDEGESMFILMEGSAHVLIDRGGHQTQVGTLKVGDCFGEMSLLTGEHRSAYVEAHTDCEVIEIGKALFSNLLHETPALAEKLSDLLAHRRMENEGVLAATMEKAMIAQKQKEYAAGFFTRVSAFFNL